MLDYTTMGRFRNPVLVASLWLSLSLAGAVPGLIDQARADQADPRLPALFDRLLKTEHPLEARLTEFSIWRIWGESGVPEIDTLLEEGDAALAAEDFVMAKDRFDAAIRLRPNFAEAWNKRATLFYLAGEYQKSLDDIQKVLELEPRHFGALSGLGLVNMALSRDAAAVDAFERVLSLYPANQAAQYNLSEAKQRLQESDI